MTTYDSSVMRMAILVCALAMVPWRAYAEKVPTDAWRTAKLADIIDEQHTTTREHSHTYGSRSTSTTAESTYSVPHYVVETDEYKYEVIANGGHRRRVLPLTIDGLLKYAIVGTDFFIQDERGKEHKMTILRKTLKTPQTDGLPK